MKTARLEAFSDGVIAVIITIMVLELHVPQANGPGGLWQVAPWLGIYALSFILTGVYWINHHELLRRTETANYRVLWANLLFPRLLLMAYQCTSSRDTLKPGMEPAILPGLVRGLGTALITPFLPDGSVDHATLSSLVRHQAKNGVDFLVPCGSTGEASALTQDETDAVIRTVIEAAAGRVPVIAGCTHNSTAEAIRRASHLASIDGLSGILSANPYYSKPTQQGQYLHFKGIAEAIAPKPLLLYNIPGRTAANLEPATTLRLAELPNVIGIKESSGNLQQIGDLLANAPASFAIFSGDDYLALPIIAGGGKGLISVASNVAPRQVSDLVCAALSHDMPTAREPARKLHALNKALFAEPNPAPTKALLAMMGLVQSDTLRLPMVPVTNATREALRTVAS